MIRNFSSYKVKVKDSEIILENGRSFSHTACISFFDDLKKEVDYIELGFVSNEDVFKMIDDDHELTLDNCYIENFSIKTYKKSRNIDSDSEITINNISALNSIFDSHVGCDFSKIKFIGDSINFNRSIFLNGKVSFENSNFGNSNVNFANALFFNGDVDFKNAIFGKGIVSFKNSIFNNGSKDFQYVDFGEGDLDFTNTEFNNGDVTFINTNFNDGNVSFKVARFGNGRIDFHFSHFGKGDISFERTEFGVGRIDFRKVEFGAGRVNFNRAIFGDGDLVFEGSRLDSGKISFKKTVFGAGLKNFEIIEFEKADLLFENVDFGTGQMSFNSSVVNNLSLPSCHLDNYIDFKVKKCNLLDLTDTIVRDIIDFQSFSETVNIKALNIDGMRLLGRLDIDWDRNNVVSAITANNKVSFRSKAEQFRILKENYGNIGQYDFEDKAYIQFKRNEEKAILLESVSKNKISILWSYPAYWFKKIVFDKIGLYATSPQRVFTSLILIYVIFSSIHLLLPYFLDTSINCIPSDIGFIDNIFATFYYSAITFLTIGYGDCSPVGILRFVASLEGFFGVFMMSYFTVAFARKILR